MNGSQLPLFDSAPRFQRFEKLLDDPACAIPIDDLQSLLWSVYGLARVEHPFDGLLTFGRLWLPNADNIERYRCSARVLRPNPKSH